MKRRNWLMLTLASMMASGLCVAQASESMGEIYKNRCAKCHGMKADGVSMMKEMPGVKAGEAGAHGMASQEQADIHGPALNMMSQEALQQKLMDFQSKGFESSSYHSVMRANLKTIEKREGDVDAGAMAAYIYNTFGEGAQ